MKHSAQRWFVLLGSEYRGGGGGKGFIAHTTKCKPVIYHQATNGATNYHDAPNEFAPYLDKALAHHAKEVISTAMAYLDADILAAAKDASDELNQMSIFIKSIKGEENDNT